MRAYNTSTQNHTTVYTNNVNKDEITKFDANKEELTLTSENIDRF